MQVLIKFTHFNYQHFNMKRIINALSVFILLATTAIMLNSCKSKETKNIIFIIGDGMGLQEMFAAYTANGGSLNLERVSHVGLQKNYSANKYITDSAASGTALACGSKTNNGMIGVDTSLNVLESFLKVAERYGMATGLVSTSSITHATPASFIANEESRNSYENIAADFLETDVDLVFGGGLDHFSKRADGRDLTVELKANGYEVVTDLESFEAFSGDKIYALTAPVHNPRVTEGRGDMLPRAVRKALLLLNREDNGFFLMVEGSQIDWGGHKNDQEYVITETLDLDAVVKEALDFAEEDGNTLVVVTADHETGGMVVLNGNPQKRWVQTNFTTGGHTGILIPVYAYGPGAELFTGIYENTEFKPRFMQLLGMQEN